MLDHMAVTGAACEAAGAATGWEAAVRHTANAIGPSADGYRDSMLKANPFTEQSRLLMDLASVPEGTTKP